MKYTDYLRWGVLASIFLVPLVPFIVANGMFLPNLFFPFITGKNFVFRILIAVMVLCYVLLAMREPKYRPRGSMLMWTALAFVGWMGIATFFSVDPIKSFWSNFERMEGFVGLVHLFVWFVIAGAVLSAENLWHRFFNVAIGASAVQGLYALLQLGGALAISTQSGVRLDTTFGNAAYFAVYMLAHVFLTLYMMARTSRSSGLMWLYGSALVLQFGGLYFSETRGAFLGLIGGLIIAAAWVAIRGKGVELRTLRRVAFSALGVIALLVVVFFAIRNTPLVQYSNTLQRLAAISLEDNTTQSRFLIWQMAGQGAMERPIFGWGQENFSFIFNKYYNPAMYGQEQWFDRAHNQFLDWLVAGGVPAFLLHLGLYLFGAWAIVRSRLTVAEQAALLGLLAAYAVNNSFVFDNLVSAIFLWVLLAYLHSISRTNAPSLSLSRPMGDHSIAVAAPIVIGVVLIGAWALNAPGFTRAATLVDALQTQRAVQDASGATVGAPRDPQENLNQFVKAAGPSAWPGNPLGRQESVEQMLQFASNQVAPSSSINPALKEQVFTASYAAGMQQLAERPGDARLELFVATFLAQFGQSAEALTHLQEALKFSPKKQQILIQLGGTLLQANNTEQGLAALKTAFELDQRYDAARLFYVAGLYLSGQDAPADALLTERYGTTVVDDDQLLQIYMNAKQFDRAESIWRLRITKDPQNAEIRLGLASVQFASCNLPATVATLKEIIALAPVSAPQMQELITQIENGTLKCPQ